MLDANRPSPPHSRPSRSSAAIFPLVLCACGVLVAAGLWLALGEMGTGTPDRRAVGLVLLAAGTLSSLIGAYAFGLWHELHAARAEADDRAASLNAALADRLSHIAIILTQISEQQLISDRAKSVAYRDKDRDALRRAIAEDLARSDFEAAKALVDDMEATFGYRAESDRLRTDIAQRREDSIRKQLVDVHDKIDRLARAEDWSGAQQEAARFISLYGDYEPARKLPTEIESRRQAHKRQLLDRWNDCVLRHDGDAGIEVLRLLDPYLTPAEGERLAESARSIINDRKSKLRDLFTAAANRQDWQESIRIGETIQHEFPNSKFAHEISDILPTLRERAATPV